MTILLFGHDGQIGCELAPRLKVFGDLRGLSYPEINFSRPTELRSVIRGICPQLIVNAAAYTTVDKAEQEQALARAVNGIAPGIIAEEARRLEALFVHYSTDFVFDGKKGRAYTEDDTPNPLSMYGQTKLEGDQAVESMGGHYLIFRTSWIYGLKGNNFLLTMRRLAAERDELRIVDDQIGTPTWCGAVGEATTAVLEAVCGPHARISIAEAGGLYNMVCTGAVSWYGFAKAFLPESVNVKPISTTEYPTPAKRPAFSVLDCTRLNNTFGVTMPSWQEALKECLEGSHRAPA